ncbi:MAG: 30S ribosomal protein S3 [Gammaproteobacteria bacterium]
MGQKVNPIGIRLGIVKDWASRWYSSAKDFSDTLYADMKVREHLRKRLAQAGVSHIQIDRPAKNARVTVHTARPGVIIGKSGRDVEAIRDEISKIVKVPVHVTIEEVRKPELDAKLVAESVAQQLVRRIMFRRAMKRAVTASMRSGALGIKISISGRLGGSEIARTEWYREGRVPLHTFRADIDYAHAEALTTYGIIGIKVWIFKGEILGDKSAPEAIIEKTAKGEK